MELNHPAFNFDLTSKNCNWDIMYRFEIGDFWGFQNSFSENPMFPSWREINPQKIGHFLFLGQSFPFLCQKYLNICQVFWQNFSLQLRLGLELWPFLSKLPKTLWAHFSSGWNHALITKWVLEPIFSQLSYGTCFKSVTIFWNFKIWGQMEEKSRVICNHQEYKKDLTYEIWHAPIIENHLNST